MRLKSKTPSLFNYANTFWVVLVAVVFYLKEQKTNGNLPEGWDGIVDNAYIIIGIIGVILLKLPTKDKVLQSDRTIEEKVAIKKEQGNPPEPPIEDQTSDISRFKK